jgi:hypothetical protein
MAGVLFASTCLGAEPDIQGLRIGSTPEATRAMFKSRVLTSNTLRNSYREESAQLSFVVPGRGAETVPNSKFLAKMSVSGSLTDSPRAFVAVFGPEPGREGVIAISRQELPENANRPTLAVLEKAIRDKYGPPTFSIPPVDKRAPQHTALKSYWTYDSSGALRAASSLDKNFSNCMHHHGLSISQELWVIRTPGAFKVLEQLIASCGAIFLSVEIGLTGPPGPNTLVAVYSTSMTGFEAALRSLKVASQLTAKARDASTDMSIKKGQQVKPPTF